MIKKTNLLSAVSLLRFYRTAFCAVTVSVFSVVLVAVVIAEGKWAVQKEMDCLGIDSIVVARRDAQSQALLNKELLDHLRTAEGVQCSAAVQMDGGKLQLGPLESSGVFWGISPELSQLIPMELLHGRMINYNDLSADEAVCVIDEKLARDSFCRTDVTGQQIQLQINGIMRHYRIVGVVKTKSDLLSGLSGGIMPYFVYLPHTTLSQISAKEGFDQILFSAECPEQFETAKVSLRAILHQDQNDDLDVYDLIRQKDRINKIVNISSYGLALLSGIALVVAGFSVSSSVNSAINAQKREIGIKKCLGASSLDLIKEFMHQILFVSFMSSLSGLIISLLCCYAAVMLIGLSFRADLSLLITGIFATMILSVLFGLSPVIKAIKMQPTDALRGE